MRDKYFKRLPMSLVYSEAPSIYHFEKGPVSLLAVTAHETFLGLKKKPLTMCNFSTIFLKDIGLHSVLGIEASHFVAQSIIKLKRQGHRKSYIILSLHISIIFFLD